MNTVNHLLADLKSMNEPLLEKHIGVIIKYSTYAAGLDEELFSQQLEQFVELLESFDQDKSKFITYLYTCARNLRIDYINNLKDQSEEEILDDGEILERLSHPNDTEKEYKLKQIHKEIDNLPDREKEMLEMRIFEEKTLADIGSKFDLSRQRINQILDKVYEKLRNRL